MEKDSVSRVTWWAGGNDGSTDSTQLRCLQVTIKRNDRLEPKPYATTATPREQWTSSTKLWSSRVSSGNGWQSAEYHRGIYILWQSHPPCVLAFLATALHLIAILTVKIETKLIQTATMPVYSFFSVFFSGDASSMTIRVKVYQQISKKRNEHRQKRYSDWSSNVSWDAFERTKLSLPVLISICCNHHAEYG